MWERWGGERWAGPPQPAVQTIDGRACRTEPCRLTPRFYLHPGPSPHAPPSSGPAAGMGTLWRSQEMEMIQMIGQNDSAHVIIEALGKLGICEFRDVHRPRSSNR